MRPTSRNELALKWNELVSTLERLEGPSGKDRFGETRASIVECLKDEIEAIENEMDNAVYDEEHAKEDGRRPAYALRTHSPWWRKSLKHRVQFLVWRVKRKLGIKPF